MKVYFTASPRGHKKYKDTYKVIYDELKNLGYTHVSDEILDESSEEFYEKLQKEGKEGYTQLYKSKINAMQQADINVFECTTPGLGLGFTVLKSLDLNKPTVVLTSDDNPPYFLLGAEDEKLVVRTYKPENVKQVLKEIMEQADQKRDKRFNFFISPELLTYLEDASNKQNITKSTFIRNLIQDHRKKYGSRD